MSNRIWFWNLGRQVLTSHLVNTLLPNNFKLWIDAKLEERKHHIILKRRLTVNVLTEFKAALVNSKSVSGNPTFGSPNFVSWERSNFLLSRTNTKESKKRRDEGNWDRWKRRVFKRSPIFARDYWTRVKDKWI